LLIWWRRAWFLPFERTSRMLSTETKLSFQKNWARDIFWFWRVINHKWGFWIIVLVGVSRNLSGKLEENLNFGRLIIFLCPFLESNTSLYLIGFWLDAKSVNHLMRWLIPIGQMSDGLGHNGRKLTLYAVDHILGCGPWGSSQIENAGAECIFCVSCPFVRTGGLLLVFLMIDHLHVKHSSCEENYAFRSKKVTRSTTFGPRRYHLSSPQNVLPYRMGCASLTTWFPFPLKVRLNQPAFTTTKKHNFTCGKCGFK